jgi:hypothetical protein
MSGFQVIIIYSLAQGEYPLLEKIKNYGVATGCNQFLIVLLYHFEIIPSLMAQRSRWIL